MKAYYNNGLRAMGDGYIDWRDSKICAALIDLAAYTVNVDTDKALDRVPLSAILAICELTNKTIFSDKFEADDCNFENVPFLDYMPEAMIIYHDGGGREANILIAYLDGNDAPLYRAGNGDIYTQWDKVNGVLPELPEAVLP